MQRDQNITASDISTPATTKSLGNYQEGISKFDDEDWTYIPMPEDMKYYNIKNKKNPQDMNEEQFINSNFHILEVMEMLLDYPFLLVEEENSYEIINLSNLNKRRVKDYIYPALSEMARRLANQIEKEHNDSEELFDMVGEFTIGLWVQDKRDDVELHIAEYLNLREMKNVIRNNESLRNRCDFASKNKVDKLGGIEKLRNRVMHGNRTLVDDRDTLESHVKRIKRAERIIERLPDPDSR